MGVILEGGQVKRRINEAGIKGAAILRWSGVDAWKSSARAKNATLWALVTYADRNLKNARHSVAKMQSIGPV